MAAHLAATQPKSEQQPNVTDMLPFEIDANGTPTVYAKKGTLKDHKTDERSLSRRLSITVHKEINIIKYALRQPLMKIATNAGMYANVIVSKLMKNTNNNVKPVVVQMQDFGIISKIAYTNNRPNEVARDKCNLEEKLVGATDKRGSSSSASPSCPTKWHPTFSR